MALLFCSPEDDPEEWRQALLRRMPDLDLRIWPETGDPAAIDVALVWRVPPGLLRTLPNLRLVLALSAGVDAMLADPTLPEVPLCRLVDPSLARGMSEFILARVLHYHRGFDVFAREQRRARWRFSLYPRPRDTVVGLLGLGELGSHVAGVLLAQGFTVRGWSRTRRQVTGVTAFAGADELAPFLSDAAILACLLPLTAATRGILARDLFAGLPVGARVINAARGGHLVEQDLIDALDTGHLAHASLDCFEQEPLPPEHPFWRHPRIDITPHVAAFADPDSAADEVVDNLLRLRDGRPLRHLVDRARGY